MAPPSLAIPAHVRLVDGSIFESRLRTITNPVNCVGVMGRGLAREFRYHYPRMYGRYQEKCARGEVRPGQPYLHRGLRKHILVFPTKAHWRDRSQLVDLTEGLARVVAHQAHQAHLGGGLALPALGCGLGGLAWAEVLPLLLHYAGQLRLPVEIYLPKEVSRC